MKVFKLLRTNRSVIVELKNCKTAKDAVLHCIKNKISLEHADLEAYDLACIDFKGVCLDFANLKRADLSHCDFEDCNLAYVNLRGAYMPFTNLKGANLAENDLSGCVLSKAFIKDCYMLECNFKNVTMLNTTGTPFIDGAIGIYRFNKKGGRTCYAIEHDDKLMISAGCFWGSLDTFEEACKKRYEEPLEAYAPQIAYLRELEKSLYTI